MLMGLFTTNITQNSVTFGISPCPTLAMPKRVAAAYRDAVPRWTLLLVRHPLAGAVGDLQEVDRERGVTTLFCHVYGRAKSRSQFIPGWPYSFGAALETGRTSWTAFLDAARLEPADDMAAVTADQLRAVAQRLFAAGHHALGDPKILIVCDAGYGIPRLAFLLADLPCRSPKAP